MSRIPLFNSPFLLGFDHFERVVDKLSKEGYPPYNVEQIGDNGLRITLAVAGFAIENLHVTVEDNQLVIKGKQEDDPEAIYLYRGIATRHFQRSFLLADGIEVMGAHFHNGLLNIDLMRPKSKAKVKHINITSEEEPSTRFVLKELPNYTK